MASEPTDLDVPTPGDVPERQLKPANAVLAELRNGIFHQELTEAIVEMADAVRTYNKKGKLTITFIFDPVGTSQIQVTDEIKADLPKPAKGRTLKYIDPHGNLVNEDPDRPQLPIHEVPRAAVQEVNQP